MNGGVWAPNMTRHARYCDDSDSSNDSVISKYILLYSFHRQQKCLKILDVGCSTGSPARHLAGYLRIHGINAVIDGLDTSKKVKKMAELNLNKFYLGNLFDVHIESIYDIVICSRLLRFLDPLKQRDGVSKCMRFCNNNGVLITDGITDTRHTVNGYAMLTSTQRIDERTSKMYSRNVKLFFYKRLIPGLNRIWVGAIRCISPLLYPIFDEKNQSDCVYCRAFKLEL